MCLFSKLFLTDSYFTIAIGKHSDDRSKFIAEYSFKACKNDWFADPIIVQDEERHYLFYEAVDGMHGRIECREILSNGTISNPTVILSGNEHYSYPFVFYRNGKWYMIPETSCIDEVGLYTADSFPHKWRKIATLLKGKYVDTTVFEYKKQWYLLTFEINGVDECVIPYAYELLADMTVGKRLQWDDYNPLFVRGAGPVYVDHGRYYRPVQISRSNRYGDGVGFVEIQISEYQYSEQKVGCLYPKYIKSKVSFFDGLHTFSESGKYSAIDIRCRDFDFMKVSKKIMRMITTKLKMI